MQYQIICHSPNGYAKIYAKHFLQFLPEDTVITGTETSVSAPFQIICFETGGMHPDTIPPEIVRCLTTLEGHSLFLLAVVPFMVNDLLEGELLRMVIPLLPRDCDFLGMRAAPSCPSTQLLQDLRQRCTEVPENSRMGMWLERCERAVGHPNQNDLEASTQFVKHVLGIAK